ncbi:MAG: hypothetical protein ABIQ01_01730 [Pseudolysinimonas sp.]
MTWLQRNRWALLALVVLVPAAIVAAMSVDLFRYYGSLAQHPVVVPAGEPGEYTPQFASTDDNGDPIEPPAGGRPTATMTLDDYTIVAADSDTGREVGLLPGTEGVAALIHVDAAGMTEDAYSCDAVLTAPGPEGERTWEPASSGLEIDYSPSGDLTSYCSLSEGSEFDWEVVFVVPEGVGEIATLSITRSNFPPERVLQLDH